MEKKSVAGMIVMACLIAVLMATPPYAIVSSGSAAPSIGHGGGSAPSVPSSHVAAAGHPLTATYPRMVLVETFTAQWCVFCEMESQALFTIQHQYSPSVLAVGEIHVCYSQSSCGDNYITQDGTSNTRSAYYAVGAFPDVFFDGGQQALGASNTLAELQARYTSAINNASAIPGNVSIVQTASVRTSTVTSHASITSAITGTYHAITYLEEFIGKNDSTGHDIDHVVRESLADQTVSLTAGATTELIGSGPIGAGWNTQHFGVITLVQDNSTKIIENANRAPVTTLTTGVTLDQSAVNSGGISTVTVQVSNSSTGAAVVGATVTVTSNNGGSLNPAMGVTGTDGIFTSTFTAPAVSAQESIVLSAQVAAANYTAGSASTTLTVNPLVYPSVPAGLSVAPASQQVSLNWSAPASGGGGVTYYVYRSSTPSGTYEPLGITTTPSYVDLGLAGGQAYWYKVSARNVAGFSANTSAIAAISVAAVTTGLSAYTGWWLSIDSVNFTSDTNASLSLFLPQGFFGYSFGPRSYAYTAPQSSGSITVGGAPLTISAGFLPRYAALQGTVNPSTATVTIDGAAVPVVSGSFSQVLKAGTYSVGVTAPGYRTNTTAITLTPGNTTSVTVQLVPTSSSNGVTPSDQWFTGNGLISLAVLAAIGVAAVLAAMMVLTRKRKRGAPPTETTDTEYPYQPPSQQR